MIHPKMNVTGLTATLSDPEQYNLNTRGPLKIGFGQHDFFNGKIKDVRIYKRALVASQIKELTVSQEH